MLDDDDDDGCFGERGADFIALRPHTTGSMYLGSYDDCRVFFRGHLFGPVSICTLLYRTPAGDQDGSVGGVLARILQRAL